MALNSTTNAAELTAEQVRTVLVQPLEQRSLFLAAVQAAGGTIIDTAGPLRIPRMAPATTPEWYAQNEQIGEEDPDFGELELLPSNMKSVKVITRFSNELARQSVVALDAALRTRLVTDVAATVDTQLFSDSDGTTGVTGGVLPAGIFSYASGGNAVPTASWTIDGLIEAQGVMLGDHIDPAGLRWVLTPAAFTAIRKIKTATGSNQPVLQPDVSRAGGFTVLGTPVLITDRVPTGVEGGLVDFSKVVVARDVAPSVKFLDQTYGDFDQQAIRVVYRLDAKPTHDEAVFAFTTPTP